MRRIALAVGAVIVLVAVSVALLYLFVDVNRFRPALQADLQKELHRPVTLGTMSLGLFPPSIRVNNVVVGENPAFPTGRPFLTARQIRVRASLFQLLRGQLRVEELKLIQPNVEMVGNAAGQWNFSDLTSLPPGDSRPVSFSRLQVEEGSFAASDLGKPASRTVFDHLRIDLTDFSPGKTYHLQASVQLPGGKTDSFRFEGSGQAGLPKGDFQGRLVLTNAPLAGLARFAGSALAIDGKVTGKAELHRGIKGSDGNLQLEVTEATARGKAIGFPVRISGRLQGDPAMNVSRFTGSVQAGTVPISINGEADGKASTLRGSVVIKDADLSAVLGVGSLQGVSGLNGSGVVSVEIHAGGPIAGPLAFSGSGALRQAELQSVDYGKAVRVQSATFRFDSSATSKLGFDFDADRVELKDLPESAKTVAANKTPGKVPGAFPPWAAAGALHLGVLAAPNLTLSDVRATYDYTQDVLTLSPFSAQLFGGTQNGSARLDLKERPAALDLSFQLSGVDANQLLSGLTSVRDTLYGNLSSTGRIHVTPSASNLARSLSGTFSLNLVKGRFARLSVLRELSAIGKFAGIDLNAQNATSIRRMTGTARIVNGLATTGDLEIAMDQGSFGAEGSANLVNQALDLKVTAVLSRTLSRQVGGSGIGGYLSTALSNGKGELVIPARVTGTFTSPHFAPDPARLAEMRLKNILPSLSGPGGIQGLVDAISGEKSKGKTGTVDRDSIQGILDLFRRKN